MSASTQVLAPHSDFYSFIAPHAHLEWVGGLEAVSLVRDDSDIVLEFRHEPTPGESTASTHIYGEWTLPSHSPTMWVSYAVKFMPGFDFANGGKIHGIGGGSTPTGGDHGRDGMSARMMFKDGTLQLYMYHLNMKNTWGDYYDTGFALTHDDWIAITLRANAGTATHPGFVHVYINGDLLVDEKIQFMSDSDAWSDAWKIDKAILSAFHGGSGTDAKWVPKNISRARFKGFTFGNN